MTIVPLAYDRSNPDFEKFIKYWELEIKKFTDSQKDILDFFVSERLYLETYLYVFRKHLAKGSGNSTAKKAHKILEGQLLLVLLLVNEAHLFALFFAALTKAINEDFCRSENGHPISKYLRRISRLFYYLGKNIEDREKIIELFEVVSTIYYLKMEIKSDPKSFIQHLRKYFREVYSIESEARAEKEFIDQVSRLKW